ncbi:protein NO VEIN domain-containing protein [Sciscionella marina]|uniref:protein NO VEIN domain-containing protein n=1 Tax=Sciscionella marina TaxID=508770 RepID=UPI000373E3EA|nr:DUF3883 domain-containing protein [Sciscionella marina]
MSADLDRPGRSATLPGVLQIQAAYWVTQVLDETGAAQNTLNRSYLNLPTGGWHSRASLLAGQQLLADLGLIVERGSLFIPQPTLLNLRGLPPDAFVETLLERILTERKDMWLPTFASSDLVFWERVPEDAKDLLCSVFEDPQRRDTFVLSAARKVDATLLAEIGAEGEEAVVHACREYLNARDRGDLADQVARLSLQDDTLGYDVSSPDCRGRRHHLEVKATRALGGRVEFYITRNEAQTGATDPMWALVVARQEITSTHGPLPMHVIGWLTYRDVAAALPSDAPADKYLRGRWASARLTVPDTKIRPGLPLDRD